MHRIWHQLPQLRLNLCAGGAPASCSYLMLHARRRNCATLRMAARSRSSVLALQMPCQLQRSYHEAVAVDTGMQTNRHGLGMPWQLSWRPQLCVSSTRSALVVRRTDQCCQATAPATARLPVWCGFHLVPTLEGRDDAPHPYAHAHW